MTLDFLVTFTDLGVCYTFSPRDQKMETSEADITEKEVETGGVTHSGTCFFNLTLIFLSSWLQLLHFLLTFRCKEWS